MITEINLTPKGKSEKVVFYICESEVAAIVPHESHTMLFLRNYPNPFEVQETPEEIKWQFSTEAMVERAKKVFSDMTEGKN